MDNNLRQKMSSPNNKPGQNLRAGKVIYILFKRYQKWRAKAKVRQKKNRDLGWRIRDLERSRSHWRQRALRAESILPPINPVVASGANFEDGVRAKGYRYSTWQVMVSILWYLYAGVGFRGVSKCWEILGGSGGRKVPHPCTVRQWVLRLGYHKLLQEVEKADDWVYIADYTAQMGNEQCLAILGLRLGALRSENRYALNHKDVRLLDLSIVNWANGEHFEERLEAAAKRTGPPCQIVTDCCSTMKKGVRLWQEKGQQSTVHTYDISHVTATKLEKLLEHDPQWQHLTSEVNRLQKNIVQTSMSFLAPPSLRKNARYMNLEPLIKWTSKILAYAKKGDFSLCSDKGGLDQKNIEFHRQFDPVLALRPFLLALQQLFELVQYLMEDFKNNGLSLPCFQKWQLFHYELLEDLGQSFFKNWMADLQKQVEALQPDQCYVASSDIVESLFGHYKNACQTQWLKGMSPSILIIPAFSGPLDQGMVHTALEKSPPMDTIHQWFYNQRKEPSFLTKRRQALKPVPKRSKTVGTKNAKKGN